ncbi:MAG: heme exporter protein CcmD [Sulfurifustis sp.]
MSWAEFFAMGNYAFYVWTAYGLAAFVLIVNLVAPLRRRKTLRKQLQEYYRIQRETR